MNSRIVASGIGVVSAIGTSLEAFEEALYRGSAGIGPSELLGEGCIAAEVRNFRPEKWLGSKGLRVLDRSSRLLAVAAQMALTDSALPGRGNGEASVELGLICGTMFGSVHSIASFDWSGLVDKPKYVNPMRFPNTVINAPAGQAAIKHKLRGPNSTICAGIASGLYALHYAAEFLRLGRAEALLAGGVEELCEESFFGFRKSGISSPAGALSPFSPGRDGTIPGEGSALWALETEESAKRRESAPLVEVCGFGSAHDAESIDRFQVEAEGATLAIRQALDDAGITAEQVACIVASATGGRVADEMEARALRNVFGEKLGSIPLTAPKAALGETLGASGALGATVAALALRKQQVPSTVGFRESEHGLRLAARPQAFEGDYGLVNAFGCDGNNGALILRRWKEADES